MEDEELKKPDQKFLAPKLDSLSVDSLQEYLANLQQEVNRVTDEIEKKKFSKVKANSFFKTK